MLRILLPPSRNQLLTDLIWSYFDRLSNVAVSKYSSIQEMQAFNVLSVADPCEQSSDVVLDTSPMGGVDLQSSCERLRAVYGVKKVFVIDGALFSPGNLDVTEDIDGLVDVSISLERLYLVLQLVSRGERFIFSTGPSHRYMRDFFSIYGLTARQAEVFHLLLRGLKNREIAEIISLSEPAIKLNLKNIYVKLGVQTRARAIRRYYDFMHGVQND